jgi:nitrilase
MPQSLYFDMYMKVAIIQDAPVPLAVSDGITQAIKLAKNAIEGGAKLIAFGETFLGGYPIWLDEASKAAIWDHPGTKALHRIMLDNAVFQGDPRLEPLQELSNQTNTLISIGAHERRRSSLYNNQLLFRPNLPLLNHRKLVPTHGERLMWNRGDGSTLAVHEGEQAIVGSLICWEHWMPLARAAMHNQREMIHIAAWPTVREIYAVASRHYAFEGRCFVLAAGLVQHRSDLLDGLERAGSDMAAVELINSIPDGPVQMGGSLIIAPNGDIIAKAGEHAEILYADLDLGLIGEGLTSLDTDGHYSRPDVFELNVNRRAMDGTVWHEVNE